MDVCECDYARDCVYTYVQTVMCAHVNIPLLPDCMFLSVCYLIFVNDSMLSIIVVIWIVLLMGEMCITSVTNATVCVCIWYLFLRARKKIFLISLRTQ